jgi:DNA-binding CsgD family transcriptional regulator
MIARYDWVAFPDQEAVPMTMVDTHHTRLTARQGQVLSLLARGMSNKEIAHALHIAEGTTRIHTAALLRALRVRNRTEAAFKAAELIEPKRSPLSLSAADRATRRNGIAWPADALAWWDPPQASRTASAPLCGPIDATWRDIAYDPEGRSLAFSMPCRLTGFERAATLHRFIDECLRERFCGRDVRKQIRVWNDLSIDRQSDNVLTGERDDFDLG